jgi:peptidoglycan hydrolase-like protein with peptidoglycan-binding domain
MSAEFSDIANHWTKDCILALAERNLVNGYPDGSFRPDGMLTRAEFAVLSFNVFPDLPAARTGGIFPDTQDHWAGRAIRWAYERGLFSGYPDGSFQPHQPISRMQAVIVLVTALGIEPSDQTEQILPIFFEDAAQMPDWTRWAIASATRSDRLIVNYPDVRFFHPVQPITRGETVAMLCRALALPNVPAENATEYIGLYDLTGKITLPFERWKGAARLMHDIQVLLTPLRLFPAGNWVTGRYDWQTEQAITQFCQFYGLPNMQTGLLDAQFATALRQADPTEFVMAQATDRELVYSSYYAQETGFNADRLAFLDRGYQSSAYASEISLFPERILQKPQGQTASLGQSAVQTGTGRKVSFQPYPALGQIPDIEQRLEFLHPDILQACISIGSFVNGDIWTRWLGRNAMQPAQMWSSTKIIPLLDLAAQTNAADPALRLSDGLICLPGQLDGYGFYNLAVDLVSYQASIGSSNSVAAMFKQFSTPGELESWLKRLTGNQSLEFQGRYGEEPLLRSPCLVNQPSSRVVLNSPNPNHYGNNLISSYDLTRTISLLGWHAHLPLTHRIPNADWKSLETIVRAMGTDSARYLDRAIEQLNLGIAIESPVIISKMGFGRSETRNRTELSYTAYFQFIDKRPRAKGNPGILRTVSMALLGAESSGDANEEARRLDARIAAEVTEILRQIVTQELV